MNLRRVDCTPCVVMASSVRALRGWEGTLQGVAWQREGARQGESGTRTLHAMLQRPELARWFLSGGCNCQGRSLYSRPNRVCGREVWQRSTGHAQTGRSPGSRITVASAFLPDSNPKGKPQVSDCLIPFQHIPTQWTSAPELSSSIKVLSASFLKWSL